MVTTGAMPVSPSFSRHAAHAEQASLPVPEYLAPVTPSPREISRGPVRDVLRGACGRPRSERTREFDPRTAHAHASLVTGRLRSLHAPAQVRGALARPGFGRYARGCACW